MTVTTTVHSAANFRDALASLSEKELIVWLPLRGPQVQLYRRFLESAESSMT